MSRPSPRTALDGHAVRSLRRSHGGRSPSAAGLLRGSPIKRAGARDPCEKVPAVARSCPRRRRAPRSPLPGVSDRIARAAATDRRRQRDRRVGARAHLLTARNSRRVRLLLGRAAAPALARAAMRSCRSFAKPDLARSRYAHSASSVRRAFDAAAGRAEVPSAQLSRWLLRTAAAVSTRGAPARVLEDSFAAAAHPRSLGRCWLRADRATAEPGRRREQITGATAPAIALLRKRTRACAGAAKLTSGSSPAS